MEALDSAAAEGAVSISDAAALQQILEAVQDLCFYEPEGAICYCRAGLDAVLDVPCLMSKPSCMNRVERQRLEAALASLCTQ